MLSKEVRHNVPCIDFGPASKGNPSFIGGAQDRLRPASAAPPVLAFGSYSPICVLHAHAVVTSVTVAGGHGAGVLTRARQRHFRSIRNSSERQVSYELLTDAGVLSVCFGRISDLGRNNVKARGVGELATSAVRPIQTFVRQGSTVRNAQTCRP